MKKGSRYSRTGDAQIATGVAGSDASEKSFEADLRVKVIASDLGDYGSASRSISRMLDRLEKRYKRPEDVRDALEAILRKHPGAGRLVLNVALAEKGAVVDALKAAGANPQELQKVITSGARLAAIQKRAGLSSDQLANLITSDTLSDDMRGKLKTILGSHIEKTLYEAACESARFARLLDELLEKVKAGQDVSEELAKSAADSSGQKLAVRTLAVDYAKAVKEINAFALDSKRKDALKAFRKRYAALQDCAARAVHLEEGRVDSWSRTSAKVHYNYERNTPQIELSVFAGTKRIMYTRDDLDDILRLGRNLLSVGLAALKTSMPNARQMDSDLADGVLNAISQIVELGAELRSASEDFRRLRKG